MKLNIIFISVAILATVACNLTKKVIVDESKFLSTIKVACVGNSITYGYGINKRDSLSYPALLQQMLGQNWEVRNFGISARTLLTNGDLPYINEQQYSDALSFNPDVVLIKLGTNDTKPHNWVHKDEYINDYKQLINSFAALQSKPIIVLLKAVPAFPDRWGITDSIINMELNPLIEKLAKELNLHCIDLYTPLKGRNDLFPDLIHPNEDGAEIMAAIIYNRLTGRLHEH